MTRADIIALAKQAGITSPDLYKLLTDSMNKKAKNHEKDIQVYA